jgi:hypothetical protein
MTVGKVTKRALGPNGTVAGAYDENPCLNAMIYEVGFPNGQLKEHAANVIADNMLTQVDFDGHSLTMMEAMINHREDDDVAVSKADMCLITNLGQTRMRKTAVGWTLLVNWADVSETWTPLKDMKESHPVKMAEFAKSRSLANEPAFAWWVLHALQKRNIMLSKINTQIRKTTHKCSIETPTSIDNANEIDRSNNNTLWKDGWVLGALTVGDRVDGASARGGTGSWLIAAHGLLSW